MNAEVGALFVPATAEIFLARKVGEYAHQNTPKQEPKHEAKFAPVETVRAGTVESLWTDQRPIPAELAEWIWWECWCWRDRASHLVKAAERLNLRASDRRLYFPELEVIPVYANRTEISRLLQNTDAIEELRRATDTPAFFTTTVRREQDVWVGDLVDRVELPEAGSPAVCILDGGVAREHPLLAPALDPGDCLTVDPRWGIADHDSGGHGTNMAGAVLYADLTFPLADQRTVALDFKLESVKFLPPAGFQPTDPMSYGAITQAAVALPEIENPERLRAFCMAVTNDDVSGERPTSWSAAIDQICAGRMPGDEPDERANSPGACSSCRPVTCRTRPTRTTWPIRMNSRSRIRLRPGTLSPSEVLPIRWTSQTRTISTAGAPSPTPEITVRTAVPRPTGISLAHQ